MTLLLLCLISSQTQRVINMRTIFEIEEFYRPEDGDDFYPAMWRSQQIGQLPPNSIDPQGEIGWTILFGPKVYRFSRPIELVRCMRLQGSGGSDVPGTRFVFFNDTPGLVIHRAGIPATITLPDFLDDTQWQPKANIPPRLLPPADDPNMTQATGTIIENIQLEGSFILSAQPNHLGEAYVSGGSFLSGQISYALYFDRDLTRGNLEDVNKGNYGILVDPFDTMSKPDRRCHGIIAYAKFTLKNSVVKNFSGHGVYIYGNVNVANADYWMIDTVMIQDNGNNGLHVVGGDAIGVAINLQSNGNRFWGIADLSYGQGINQYIGGQTSYNHYGGFLRPKGVRFTNDPNPNYVSGDGFPLAGPVLLRGFYGEANGASTGGSNYANKFLQFNRFIWGNNILEHCLLNNDLRDVVDGKIGPPGSPATGIDTGYLDTRCNIIELEGEFIPSFNAGIRLQDRLSLMAYGSTDQKVWIRAMTTAEAEAPIDGRPMPDYSLNSFAKPLPEVIFFTDPVAGGYVGSIYCIVGVNDDGTKTWGHRKFGRIES
jgi:hypothetical protein